MKLILNGINGEYLKNITLNAAEETDFVEASVAYASDSSLLFDWCLNNKIPLRFWGRFDASIPISTNLLRKFLQVNSPNFSCKLLKNFHAKIIWWHGYGVYIGSANLSSAAWYNNIEAGCFFTDDEITNNAMDGELHEYFHRIDQYASPLNEELLKEIEQRAKELDRIAKQDKEAKKKFLATKGIKQWEGLAQVSKKSAAKRNKENFLNEWYSTLQTLRGIGQTINEDKNRPTWIPAGTPPGAQADQFLHAHYYTSVIFKNKSLYEEQYEKNKHNPELALKKAISWWRQQKSAPNNENIMLLEWAPFLHHELSQDRLLNLTESDFEKICRRVWSIQDHGKQIPNTTLGLPTGTKYTMDEKIPSLANFLYSRRATNGMSILEVINYVLYGGTDDDLPVRLWESISPNGQYRVEHLGKSALGELVGWALPNRFPPRNNRTSKSLRSLGFPVDVRR